MQLIAWLPYSNCYFNTSRYTAIFAVSNQSTFDSLKTLEVTYVREGHADVNVAVAGAEAVAGRPEQVELSCFEETLHGVLQPRDHDLALLHLLRLLLELVSDVRHDLCELPQRPLGHGFERLQRRKHFVRTVLLQVASLLTRRAVDGRRLKRKQTIKLQDKAYLDDVQCN